MEMSTTKETIHSSDGKITGKTVRTDYDNGSSKTIEYSNLDIGGGYLSPTYKAESKTSIDAKGNSSKTKY
jgi:hypothetical protein